MCDFRQMFIWLQYLSEKTTDPSIVTSIIAEIISIFYSLVKLIRAAHTSVLLFMNLKDRGCVYY